ncbi:HPF/RaiA family ribosome-associated protein [Streptomyces sp. NPDC048496]|uniref:ribosome hibernation promotion factor n=1 Tax=Streptomyces sp. NPDC048496 TaxID=3365558 RepID=UPI0037227B85
MTRLKTRPAVDIQVEARGQVPRGAAGYAREKTLAALDHLSEPVLAARVKLTQAANAASGRPAAAQAVVDVNGRPVRAHVAAGTMFEAVDLLRDRLVARLARTRRHNRGDHHGDTVRLPGDRWHDDGHEHRPQHRQLPAQERQIVRHKSFGLPQQTPEEAVFDLESMDYDFYLFADADSGRDSVVYRDPRTGYHRMATAGKATAEPQAAPHLTVSEVPAPEISVREATERLALTRLPFVFFLDSATGRGHVLYHRYDGHYGLITPAA